LTTVTVPSVAKLSVRVWAGSSAPVVATAVATSPRSTRAVPLTAEGAGSPLVNA
jgi:hypothetical protein